MGGSGSLGVAAWSPSTLVVLATDVDDVGFASRLDAAVTRYDASPFRISLSVGTSSFDPETPTTLEKLVVDADARMYEDKRARRAHGLDVVKSTSGGQ